MSGTPVSPLERKWPAWIPWGLWLGYGLCWTLALLSALIIEARDEVLDQDISWLAGKILHVVAYMTFCILTSFLPTTPRRRWLCLALVSLHGMTTEAVQDFFNRTSSFRDVGLDHLGILLGLLLTNARWFQSTNLSESEA